MASYPPSPRLRHSDYSVAIICPMEVELQPVLALMDDQHSKLTFGRDQNAYTLDGNSAAAIVVTQLLNDFPSIRFSLLVGVGGGIPDDDYGEDNLVDIRLGDVVVSKARGQFGGVMQFDRGKNTPDKFIRTGSLNKPPMILCSSVERLKAAHGLTGHKISHNLAHIIEKFPKKAEDWTYPGTQNDKLFRPDYPHQGAHGKGCKKCDHGNTIQRKSRADSEPRIHYGTIGSSNRTIEDSQMRDMLREEFDLLCVEMEAAGLMEAFPSLVIRGISDYADSHKNKRWQPYAAAVAAAYARELLDQIPPSQMQHIQTAAEAMNALSSEVQENSRVVRQLRERQISAEEERTLEWLSPLAINFSGPHNAARCMKCPETGQWLLKHKSYQDWRDKTAGLTWLLGAAGCGKTILCSTVIEDLTSHQKHAKLGYWYFQFSEQASQDMSQMLRSLMRQLSSSPLSPTLHQLRNRHCQPGSQPNLDDLQRSFDEIVQQDEDTYIVLDALDEIPPESNHANRSALLRWIRRIFDGRHPRLHVLITSRPEPDITSILHGIVSWAMDIEQQTYPDIKRYVTATLAQEAFDVWNEDVKSQIFDKLLSYREMRFRWAELQLRRFEECADLTEVGNAISTIPKTLEDSYEEAFEKIAASRRDGIKRIMMWLVVAYRSLTPHQAAAIAGYVSADRVLKICSSVLVTIVDADKATASYPKIRTQYIRLAHFSVKEFLILKRHEEHWTTWYKFSTEMAHQHVCVIAIQYLLDQDDGSINPLLRYSATYWPDHAREVGKENELGLQVLIDRLFGPEDTRQFQKWTRMYDEEHHRLHADLDACYAAPVYYATVCGLQRTVERLFWNEIQITSSGGILGNLINAAAIHGHAEIVKWLAHRCHEPANHINVAFIARRIKRNAAHTMEAVLRLKGVVRLTPDLVRDVARKANEGGLIMEQLLNQLPHDASFTESTIKQAAYDYDVMRVLLEQRPSEVRITEGVVEAAANNRVAGNLVMQLLLERRPEDIHITDRIVKAAARNSFCGHIIMQMFLVQRPKEVRITEAVIAAAAGNFFNGSAFISLLLKRRPDEVRLTEAVLEAAARNGPTGYHVMKQLLDTRPDDAHVTEAVLIAAAGNFMCAADVIELLLSRRPDDVHITDAVLEAAAANEVRGAAVMQFLLHQRPGDVRITENLINVAAGNKGCGQAVLKLLRR